MAKKAQTKKTQAKTTKVTEAASVKTEPEKIETKKTELEKIETKKAEPEKIETKKTELEKISTKKSEEKKIEKKAAKKAAKKVTKNEMKKTLFVEYQGKQVEESTMFDAVEKAWTKAGNKVEDIKTVALYVKPEEAAVYYVINETETGSVEF